MSMQSEVDQADAAASALAKGRVVVMPRGRKGDPVEIPESVVRVLAEVLDHARRGESVRVISDDEEITTQQAADLLNVPLAVQGVVRFGDRFATPRTRAAPAGDEPANAHNDPSQRTQGTPSELRVRAIEASERSSGMSSNTTFPTTPANSATGRRRRAGRRWSATFSAVLTAGDTHTTFTVKEGSIRVKFALGDLRPHAADVSDAIFVVLAERPEGGLLKGTWTATMRDQSVLLHGHVDVQGARGASRRDRSVVEGGRGRVTSPTAAIGLRTAGCRQTPAPASSRSAPSHVLQVRARCGISADSNLSISVSETSRWEVEDFSRITPHSMEPCRTDRPRLLHSYGDNIGIRQLLRYYVHHDD